MRWLALLLVALPCRALAQHSMADMEAHGHAEADMPMSGPLGIPEARNASGTAWQPDATTARGWHTMAGGWMLMLHENVLAGYDAQGGERGDHMFFSSNWVMGMASHGLFGGQLTLRSMLSLEPATIDEDGYPLLFQTGETLHDRQHPHDLFMELAMVYRRELGAGLGLELYAAAAGEPAVGPVAFPHRFTSLANPLAPLGHHWEDSTHIAFGVLTAGLFTRTLKLEGSWFNGREPDNEDRWDLDLRAPDSYAVRLSVNPAPSWSAQASYAYLASPEAMEPEESLQRTTASVSWARARRGATAVVGLNVPESGASTGAALVEGALGLGPLDLVFARGELVSKTGEELALPMAMEDDTFTMGALSLGVAHDFVADAWLVPQVGVVGTVDVVGADLEPVYGTRAPLAVMVFMGLHPPAL